MAPDTLTTRDLDALRDEADRFIAELDEESYLHFAGHKETLELEAVYARHRDLTQVETARRLEGGPVELWRFACEGYLGNLTRSHQEKLATAEAELEAVVQGERIPYRMLRVALSNEPDRDRREALERERLRILDEVLNPVYLDAARIDRDAVGALGAPNYYELYKRFGFRLDALAKECARSARLHRAALGNDRRPSLSRPSRHEPRRRAAVGRAAAVPCTRMGFGLPARPHASSARDDAG